MKNRNQIILVLFLRNIVQLTSMARYMEVVPVSPFWHYRHEKDIYSKTDQLKKMWPCLKWMKGAGQEMAVVVSKFLITTIQVNLCCLIPRNQHKFTWIVLLKFCHQPMSSQPFLGHPLWFHNFSHTSHFGQGRTCLQLVCFWVVITSFIINFNLHFCFYRLQLNWMNWLQLNCLLCDLNCLLGDLILTELSTAWLGSS